MTSLIVRFCSIFNRVPAPNFVIQASEMPALLLFFPLPLRLVCSLVQEGSQREREAGEIVFSDYRKEII